MRKRAIARTVNVQTLQPDQLAIWSVTRQRSGAVKNVTEYVDLSTGEIIPSAELNIPTLDMRLKLHARTKALRSMRTEVRRFAVFVLGFANNRRGITPGINTLCIWYAGLHGKRPSDVRRYIPALRNAGVLAGESLLGKQFQRKTASSDTVMGEEFDASTRYLRMRMRAQNFDPASGRQTRTGPAWLVKSEVEALDAELMAQHVIDAAKLYAQTAPGFTASPIEA